MRRDDPRHLDGAPTDVGRPDELGLIVPDPALLARAADAQAGRAAARFGTSLPP
jgi:hypothetical protein